MDLLFIVVLLILAGFGLHGYLRGMVHILFSLVAVFLTIGLATIFAPYTTQVLRTQTPIYDTVKDKCTEYLQSTMESQIQQGISEQKDITFFGMRMPEEIQGLFSEEGAEQAGNLMEYTGVYEKVSDFVAQQVVQRLGWLLSFVLILALLLILIHFLDVIAKLPVLRNINRAGGLAIGLLEGLVVVWILFLVIVLCQGTEFGREMMDSIDRNMFLKVLYDNNVIEQLILQTTFSK